MESSTTRRNVTGFLVLFFIAIGCGERSDQENISVLAEEATLTNITGEYEFNTAGSPLYLNGNYYFTNNNFDDPGVLGYDKELVKDGYIQLSDKPGFGIDLNEDLLKKYLLEGEEWWD